MRFQFKNGLVLQYIYKQDFVKSFASVVVNFGAKHINYDEYIPSGIAHFLEHKMFEHPKFDYLSQFSNLGASANAYTSYNETVYYFSATTNFEKSFTLLLDLVNELTISNQSVEKEKEIIVEELRMYESDPEVKMMHEILNNMYQNTPIKYDIGGSEQSVRNTTYEQLHYCFDTFYVPNNMCITYVGSMPLDIIVKIVDNHCLSKKEGKILPQRNEIIEEKTCIPQKEVMLPIVNDKAIVGYKLEIIQDVYERKKMEYALKVLFTLFTTAIHPAYQTYLDSEKINDYFGFFVELNEDYSLLQLYIENHDIEFLNQIFDKVMHEAIDVNHFELLKKRFYGATVKMNDGFEKLGLLYGVSNFSGFSVNDMIHLLKSLTIEDIQHARDFLNGYSKSILYAKRCST